jgi:hypothetical protein
MADFTPFSSANRHIDVVTSEIVRGWGPPQGMLAPILAPITPVKDRSDEYLVWGKESFQASRKKIGHRDPIPESYGTFAKGEYKCQLYGEAASVADSELEEADEELQGQLDINAQLRVKQAQVMLGWEADCADILTDAAQYASGLTEDLSLVAGRQFDDVTPVGPIKVIDEYRRLIRKASGVNPNTILYAPDVYTFLRTDTSLFGGGASSVSLSLEDLTRLLGFEKGFVLDTLYTADGRNEDADYTLDDMWGSNQIIICNTDTRREAPTTLRTFRYNWTKAYRNGEAAARWRTENPWVEHAAYLQCRDVKPFGASPVSGLLHSAALLTKVYAALE